MPTKANKLTFRRKVAQILRKRVKKRPFEDTGSPSTELVTRGERFKLHRFATLSDSLLRTQCECARRVWLVWLAWLVARGRLAISTLAAFWSTLRNLAGP